MKPAVVDASLQWLGRVTSIHSEPLELHEPFVEVVRRFAHLPGTVALLSGGELDCAQHHILGVYPWLSLEGRRTVATLIDGSRRPPGEVSMSRTRIYTDEEDSEDVA